MSKYIDADKLIAEIERLLKVTELHRGEAVVDGSRQTLYWIKDFITSFQQEQPEVDLEKEIGHWLDKLDDKYCMLVEDYSIQDIKDTARYFAEWGAIHLNSRKEK